MLVAKVSARWRCAGANFPFSIRGFEFVERDVGGHFWVETSAFSKKGLAKFVGCAGVNVSCTGKEHIGDGRGAAKT